MMMISGLSWSERHHGVMDEVPQLLPEPVKVVLSLEVLHLQGLISLRVQAVNHQLLQDIALLMQLLEQRLQYFKG